MASHSGPFFSPRLGPAASWNPHVWNEQPINHRWSWHERRMRGVCGVWVCFSMAFPNLWAPGLWHDSIRLIRLLNWLFILNVSSCIFKTNAAKRAKYCILYIVCYARFRLFECQIFLERSRMKIPGIFVFKISENTSKKWFIKLFLDQTKVKNKKGHSKILKLSRFKSIFSWSLGNTGLTCVWT